VNVVLDTLACVLIVKAKRIREEIKITVRILVLTCSNIDSQLPRQRALRVILASPTISYTILVLTCFSNLFGFYG